MNTYEKLTVASFKAKLGEGSYKNLAGARRAIGKAQDMSATDKNLARTAAEKYFNAPASAAAASTPKAKPQKAAAKKPEVKHKASLARAAARRAGPAPAKPKAARGRPAKARPIDEAPAQAEAAPRLSKPQSDIALAEQAVAVIGKALTAIKDCKDIYPQADTSAVQNAVDALLGTIKFATTAVVPSFPKVEVAAAPSLPSPNGLARAEAVEATS